MSCRGGSGYIARLCIGSLRRQVSRCADAVWMSPDVARRLGCTSRA